MEDGCTDDSDFADAFQVVEPEWNELPSFKSVKGRPAGQPKPEPFTAPERNPVPPPPKRRPVTVKACPIEPIGTPPPRFPEPPAETEVVAGPRLHWRIARGTALFIVGSIAALTWNGTPPEPVHSVTPAVPAAFITLPPAEPAAPPPQIMHVDRWFIVMPTPIVAPQPVASASPPPTVAPAPKVFAPATPIQPPPQVILVDRATNRLPELKRPVPKTKPTVVSQPTPPRPTRPDDFEAKRTTDMLDEINRWLSKQ
jgi:hypothetical protein